MNWEEVVVYKEANVLVVQGSILFRPNRKAKGCLDSGVLQKAAVSSDFKENFGREGKTVWIFFARVKIRGGIEGG